MDSQKYVVHIVTLDKDHQPHTKVAAIYVMDHGNFYLLEDHVNMFDGISYEDGQPPDRRLARFLDGLTRSPYYRVEPVEEVNVAQDAELQPQEPKHEFVYQHKDGPPVKLTYENKGFLLNGRLLSEAEIGRIKEQVAQGVATIKYGEG